MYTPIYSLLWLVCASCWFGWLGVFCFSFSFSVPAQLPPEVSQHIKHVYYVPPQFYPFLKKLGEDTPALQPYTQKLIKGELTYDDYEEMFYKFAKPLKIYRNQIPMPYRTPEEIQREEEVAWEGAWLTYRQKVLSSKARMDTPPNLKEET